MLPGAPRRRRRLHTKQHARTIVAVRVVFPNYRSALDTLPAAAEIVEAFVLNGFALRRHEAVPHMMATSVKDLAEKAAFRADTTLVRLSDDDFERGLAKMRIAASAPSKPEMIDIDLFVFTRTPK